MPKKGDEFGLVSGGAILLHFKAAVSQLWGNHEKSPPTEHRPASLYWRQAKMRGGGEQKRPLETTFWQSAHTSGQTLVSRKSDDG